jgi:hypothetical protein
MRRLGLCVCVLALSSCAALDSVVDVLGPDGEKTGETTVGAIIAGTGEAVGDAAGSLVTGLTGNPLLGTAAAAGLASLIMGARRKRKAKADA